MRLETGIAILPSAAALPAGPHSVAPKLLLNPPANSWLTYHGDYSGQRHSKLSQITPENIGTLKQVWKFQAGQQLKASPIVANGMIYMTAPDQIWAVDAHTGKEVW